MGSNGEQRAWAEARSFAGLLGLGRAFVAGERSDFPGWGGVDTDEESDALLPALLDLNRAGVLTVASQPGRPFGPGHDGWTWGGRAFAGGLVEEPARAEELAGAARAAGLLAALERPAAAAGWDPIPVGLRDGVPYLVLGPGALAEEREIFLGAAGPALEPALRGAALLWLVDPVWGRRSRLPAVAARLARVSFAGPTAAPHAP